MAGHPAKNQLLLEYLLAFHVNYLKWYHRGRKGWNFKKVKFIDQQTSTKEQYYLPQFSNSKLFLVSFFGPYSG